MNPTGPYTKYYSQQAIRLIESGAGAIEVHVYSVLARYHDAFGRCNVNTARAAAELRITQRAFQNAVYRLARRQFTARDGSKRPVLVNVSKGHRGANSEYIDNVFLDSIADPTDGKGTCTEVPNDGKGTCTEVPNDGKGTCTEVQRYLHRSTKVLAQKYPYKRTNKEKIFSAEDAATQAPRADLAAEGPTPDRGTGEGSHDAPTMEPPTLAEWMELERRLGSGPDALTPAEEARRLEGFAIYARPPKPRGAA